METLPVTLIVKAPNQQIEDQTIKCELSWTINKLKQHLSEVYPSRPPKHEQKLIYSGQLLNDSVILKDVLRQFEGQETHTLHLVCTPKHHLTNTPQTQQQYTHTTQSNMPNTTTQTQMPPNTNTTDHQRVPNMPWMNGEAMDPNHYAMQLAWIQQAYLQYISQLQMQLATNSYANGAPGTNREPVAPQQNHAADQPAAAAPRAAQPQRDQDNPERDWLDVFYMFVRAMVLFSVVYFYSSPLRFIFVVFLGFGLYLYQVGFFRNINNNNNNNNNVQQDGGAQQDEQAPSRLMVVWTFFTTFFASLIPEIPNAV